MASISPALLPITVFEMKTDGDQLWNNLSQIISDQSPLSVLLQHVIILLTTLMRCVSLGDVYMYGGLCCEPACITNTFSLPPSEWMNLTHNYRIESISNVFRQLLLFISLRDLNLVLFNQIIF